MARGGEPSTPQTVIAAPDLSKDIEGGQAPVRDPPDEVPVLGFGFCSTKGRRQVNEDRLLFAPRVLGQNRLNFYGVFDGHAGHRASEYCRATMAERLSEALLQRGEDSAALTGDTGVSLLHSVFTQTDAAFLAAARAEGWEDGTTACSVLISGTDLFCANAGDSKAIIVRMGATLPLSAEHKPSSPSERARIEAAGGEVRKVGGVARVAGNLATSRAIGDMSLKKWVIPDPDVTHCKLSKGDDFVIIASDGLWDYVGPQAAGVALYIYIYAHTHTHAYTHTPIHTPIHTCMHTHPRAHAPTHPHRHNSTGGSGREGRRPQAGGVCPPRRVPGQRGGDRGRSATSLLRDSRGLLPRTHGAAGDGRALSQHGRSPTESC